MRLRADLIDGLKQGVVLGLAICVVALPPAWRHAPPAVPAPAAIERRLDFGAHAPPPVVRQLAFWVVDSADNGELPFVVIDKRGAQVWVFERGGRLAGTTPALLGYAPGDHTVPGIGQRPIEQVRPEERTTPAGRFVAEPGRNALGEDVVWVDYDAAVSMHRVRLTNPQERRAERLATPTTDDNRISYGCINLPPSFFDEVVWPRLGNRRAVVYVLPEVKSFAEVFPAAAAQAVAPA